MPTVTFDGQSFSIDGRRIWVLGAAVDYARVPPEAWAETIAAARDAGFNTIATTCPWLLHEPRRGRFSFEGPTDVRRFVELCHEAGMWVLLRPGPYVGNGYDAGGLPSWLIEAPMSLREASEPYLERVGLYFRKLFAELSSLQVTQGGPILLVQSEHAWLCSNPQQADRYLGEITRYLRENTVTVPLINANDLWQEAAGTIDTWRGRDDLLVHLRQLRVVQPDAPRLVSEFNPAGPGVWGEPADGGPRPASLMQWMAQVLAAGAQAIVCPFHGGTNFGFLGGRLAGRADAFVTTRAASAAPLGEAGRRGPEYQALRRLVTFARSFDRVFADLDPDYSPVTLDLEAFETGVSRGRTPRRVSAVHLRGGGGQIVFVFGDGLRQETTLVLEPGIRMPVSLGDQSAGWFLIDVDLRGSGRLDYANLCPVAMVGRSTLLLQGPARAPVVLSIDGSPLQTRVPSGGKPLVLRHQRMTIVVCNQEQIDRTFFSGDTIYTGVAGLDAEGRPIAAPRSGGAWVVTADGSLEKQSVEGAAAAPAPGTTSVTPGEWQAAPAEDYVSGESPRFATLEGPETLASCGAPLGYGWYRIQLKSTTARRRRWHLPCVADRAHLYIDGKLVRVVGVGRGARHGAFDHSLPRGEHTIVALVDNLGRFAEGNDLGERKGFYGHVYEVKRLGTVRPKIVEADAVDPFELRGYIAGRTLGQLSATEQVTWSFSHTRKAPILVEVDGAEPSGTFVLNNRPLAYYAGASGAALAHLLLEPDRLENFRRGRNVLRFAPDLRQPGAAERVAKTTTLYECTDTISSPAAWAFAKWEPPPTSAYGPVPRNAARSLRGRPCWWRAVFELDAMPAPLRFDTAGLSKGQIFINGENLGRYFTAAADGRPVGPQRRLYVPRSWIKPDEPNELVIFDEHGFAPHRARLVFTDADDR